MLLLLLAALAGAADAPKNPLVEEMTREGLAIPGGPKVKLPEPVVPDGLSADKEAAVVDKLADKFPPGVFFRKSATSPYLLTINPIGEDRRKRRGHTLDLVFVAISVVAFMVIESYRLGMRWPWVWVPLIVPLPGAFVIPLFFLLRERALLRIRAQEQSGGGNVT